VLVYYVSEAKLMGNCTSFVRLELYQSQKNNEGNFRNFQNQVCLSSCQLASMFMQNINSLASTQTDLVTFFDIFSKTFQNFSEKLLSEFQKIKYEFVV
jgi:hypothetical protein